MYPTTTLRLTPRVRAFDPGFGAVAVEAYRSNRLDAYLCMVKDCMFSWNGWKVASYLVDPRDHARPVACNASRRDQNATEQPLVHV